MVDEFVKRMKATRELSFKDYVSIEPDEIVFMAETKKLYRIDTDARCSKCVFGKDIECPNWFCTEHHFVEIDC